MKKVKVIDRLPADFKQVIVIDSNGDDHSAYYMKDSQKWGGITDDIKIIEWVDIHATSDEEIELKKLKFQLKIAEIKLKYANKVIETPLLAGSFMIQLAAEIAMLYDENTDPDNK